jgi:hypothetical protein
MGYFETSPHPRKSPASSQMGDVRGLVVPTGNGYERLVMTDQEICDDVLAAIPKVKAAAASDTCTRRWKQRKCRNGVDMVELSSAAGSAGLDPDDDADIAHALIAKTELKCHLNEVLNVLINQHSNEYEASMQALVGRKFETGKVLFKQRRKFRFKGVRPSHSTRTSSDDETSSNSSSAVSSLPQDGLVGVQTMSIRRKLSLRLPSGKRHTPQLAFASCTLQYPSQNRAIHVMKTLPKPAHDQVVRPDETRSPLRRGLDHIAMGIDIQSVHGAYSARSHSTQIMVYTYASGVQASEYTKSSSPLTNQHRMAQFSNAEDLAAQRKAIMNPEAHHVMDLLTKSLRQFESVIRRRRFGFQSFARFSTASMSAASANCRVCCKKFRFYRRDSFCQLCGNTVCNDCSQKYDVEARVGEVRRTRCCVPCVVRVDSCVFDDEDLLAALGPAVVEAEETAWRDDYPAVENTPSVYDFSYQRSLQNPKAESAALESLARLVRGSSPDPTVSPVRPTQVYKEVDSHLRSRLQTAQPVVTRDNCPVYGNTHDYAFSFADNSVAPRAPRPVAQKEMRRLHHIAESGVLKPDYDSAALDLLAQLAAKHLKCEIGYVSVIDANEQRVVGAYNYPQASVVTPRDETLCMHGVYAETPMVLKNPRRDQRFAQLAVVKDHGLQFYAGFPIRAPDGSVVASLCAGDTMPHPNITTKDYATMKVLADLAAELLVPRQK